MDRIIRTCSRRPALLLGTALFATALALSPTALAAARPTAPPSRLATFVGARAAGLNGDAARSAALYAQLAEADPGDRMVARRAVSQAIIAGDFALALRLVRPLAGAGDLQLDARLLLAADQLRRDRTADALRLLTPGDGERELGFLVPFVRAWDGAGRRSNSALTEIAQIPETNPAAAYVPEHHALLLLKLGRGDEAAALGRRAIARAGARENRLRIALAGAFARAGDRAVALEMVNGRDVMLAEARSRIASGRALDGAIDSPADAFAELLLALAIDLNRDDARALPITLARIASLASPGNPQASIVLGVLQDAAGRTAGALASFGEVGADSLFASQARDGAIRAMMRGGKKQQALEFTRRAAAAANATADDYARLGDVLGDLERNREAAEAYQQAIRLVEAGGGGGELWMLHLLRGGALEEANLWPEARAALEAAHRLNPTQPLVLNYLGYAKLERGEDLDTAEALIVAASRLAPTDAAITDSLGWAQYKRGRLAEAIATLQRAAESDSAQAEIREHLGDALFSAGRRFEARFAWEAALITAEEDVSGRIRAKLQHGLTSATAAP